MIEPFASLSYPKDEVLSERSARVIELVTSQYIATAEPVASRDIASSLSCSSATIRSEFAHLTNQGWLFAPHTSAGRVPTARAYQWLAKKDVAISETEMKSWNQIRESLNGIVGVERDRTVLKALSHISGVIAALVRDYDHVTFSGLSELAQQPEFRDIGFARAAAETLDRLDIALNRASSSSAQGVWIGDDFIPGGLFGLTVASPTQGSLIALFGPLRQPYALQRARIRYASLLLT